MTAVHQAIFALALAVTGCSSTAGNSSNVGDSGGIDMARAREVALAAVPGKILEAERETEDGIDIYSFDIEPDAASGEIREVHVDAASGAILEIETETAEHERREHDEEDERSR